jgi:hypothetical protein
MDAFEQFGFIPKSMSEDDAEPQSTRATTTYRKVHSKHGGTSAQCHRLKQTGFNIRHIVANNPYFNY